MQESPVYQSIVREAQEARDREIALTLLQDGVLLETIARWTGLSIAELQQLQQQLTEGQS